MKSIIFLCQKGPLGAVDLDNMQLWPGYHWHYVTAQHCCYRAAKGSNVSVLCLSIRVSCVYAGDSSRAAWCWGFQFTVLVLSN